MRPAVGDPLRLCPACGCWEYGGPPDCARCRALVDAVVEEGWHTFVVREFGGLPSDQERAVVELIAEDPQAVDWRVYDAALDRITCPECGAPLGAGPVGCAACDRAHGYRYAAIETDRPGVPPGNEHGVRVNVSVVRRPHVTSAPELLARRAILPALLVGALPTTAQAQRFGALVKDGMTYQELHPLVLELARQVSREASA
ncbi:MAG: hypothetical protein HOV79_18875 [Hamadaea sp.]|nr:hypothetical protein [Hamadaea sp.]